MIQTPCHQAGVRPAAGGRPAVPVERDPGRGGGPPGGTHPQEPLAGLDPTPWLQAKKLQTWLKAEGDHQDKVHDSRQQEEGVHGGAEGEEDPQVGGGGKEE